MNWWSRRKVLNVLGITEPVLNALTKKSGMLGYTSASGMHADHAVRSYQLYGTQWSLDGNYGPTQRLIQPEVYESLPPVESVGPQPPATRTRAYVYPAGGEEDESILERARKTDTDWIAHFYLVTNPWCWPNLTDLAKIGPPPLELSGLRPVPGADLHVTLYPHPSGYLGLVAVEGRGNPSQDAFSHAYDVAMPLLDELSVRHDMPLPVAHSMVIGVPSGMIHLHFSHRSKARRIEEGEEILPRCPHPELIDAYALYREAVSSSNPFHAFLTFWKVWEEAEYVRKGRGARLGILDTRVRQEVFPDLFAFGSKPEELEDPSQHPGEEPENMLRGEKFSKAKMVLRASYRVALAHAGKVDTGKPLIGASHADYQKVTSKVPVLRYVANVVLENVRATFDADREREAAEAGDGSKDNAEVLAT